MQELMKSKPYPGWKNALKHILERVSEEGYGLFVSHQELLDWMDLPIPIHGTFEEYQKYQFEVLTNNDALKEELLQQHNIYLTNVKGEGYQVMIPNDQVEKAPEKHFRKMRKELHKATMALTNVNIDLLNMERDAMRLKKLEKIAFVRTAMNKRKMPIPHQKLIENKI